jgi:hypothetical protein
MAQAVELVRRCLLRATAALERACVPYAIVGGNAVALWIARMNKGGTRNTPDVDVLLRRADLSRASAALIEAGFVWCDGTELVTFLDGPKAGPCQVLHLILADESARPDDRCAFPDVTESEPGGEFRVLSLEPLVRMKLTTFRLKDRVHVRDMIDVGLIDASWLGRLPAELAARLQELLDTPDG